MQLFDSISINKLCDRWLTCAGDHFYSFFSWKYLNKIIFRNQPVQQIFWFNRELFLLSKTQKFHCDVLDSSNETIFYNISCFETQKIFLKSCFFFFPSSCILNLDLDVEFQVNVKAECRSIYRIGCFDSWLSGLTLCGYRFINARSQYGSGMNFIVVFGKNISIRNEMVLILFKNAIESSILLIFLELPSLFHWNTKIFEVFMDETEFERPNERR